MCRFRQRLRLQTLLKEQLDEVLDTLTEQGAESIYDYVLE